MKQEILHAGIRGTIAAMAMTGMRSFTVSIGLVDESPPAAVARQKLPGPLAKLSGQDGRALIELAHWSYGAAGGVAFRLLPDAIRLRPWAGPVYGIAVWLGFELGVAPVLGLSQAKKPRVAERVALAADHLLYGLVLTETRRRSPD